MKITGNPTPSERPSAASVCSVEPWGKSCKLCSAPMPNQFVVEDGALLWVCKCGASFCESDWYASQNS